MLHSIHLCYIFMFISPSSQEIQMSLLAISSRVLQQNSPIYTFEHYLCLSEMKSYQYTFSIKVYPKKPCSLSHSLDVILIPSSVKGVFYFLQLNQIFLIEDQIRGFALYFILQLQVTHLKWDFSFLFH